MFDTLHRHESQHLLKRKIKHVFMGFNFQTCFSLTSKFIEAATTASPKRIKTNESATYPGLFIKALSF